MEHPTHKPRFLHGFRWSTWEVFFTDWLTGGFGITFLVYENQCQSLIRNKNQDQRDGSPSKGTGHHSSIPGAYMVEAINHLVALLPPHRLWHASPQTHNFIFLKIALVSWGLTDKSSPDDIQSGGSSWHKSERQEFIKVVRAKVTSSRAEHTWLTSS